jgi:hypothetical protein
VTLIPHSGTYINRRGKEAHCGRFVLNGGEIRYSADCPQCQAEMSGKAPRYNDVASLERQYGGSPVEDDGA